MTNGPAACPVPDTDRRVVIIGGGYAGTTLSVLLGRALKRRPRPNVQVLLIERDPYQQALSELDLVAAGTERAEFCELWLPAVLKGLPVHTCFNRVESIDCKRQTVTVAGGQEVEYWRLVVATGAVPSVPKVVPGLAEHALTMWSVEDAQTLQDHLRAQMKAAAAMPYAEDRRTALSFTVCGGGATGVEMAGTLGQLLPKRAAQIGLDPADINIHLIEGRDEILGSLPRRQQHNAVKRLAKLGVEVITGSMVDHVEADRVVLARGREVPSSVLVWCGGACADPHAEAWGFRLDETKRIVVDSAGKTAEHDNVYALGDVAAAPDPRSHEALPMLAQVAIEAARHATVNILAEIDGGRVTPFDPRLKGQFVSVGPSWGVGRLWRLGMSGIPAIVMKRMTYVLYWWRVGGLRLAWKRGREMLAMQR